MTKQCKLSILTEHNISLTASHTIICVWLNIPTVRVDLWVQHEEHFHSDLILVGQESAGIVVDVQAARAARVATIDLARSYVSSGNDGTDGNGTSRLGGYRASNTCTCEE